MKKMGNITEEYHKLLEKILKQGKDKGDRTGTGTRSIFHHTLEMDMSDGFPLITTKKIHTRSVIHELLWFLKGSTNTKYLNDNGVTIWDEWVKEDGSLGPIYGKQWVAWKGKELTYAERREIRARLVREGKIEHTGIVEDDFKHLDECNIPKYEPINQIQNAIDTLNNNPDSRRIMVSAWNVGEIDKMALPPCHWAFELYTEELTLEERLCEADKFNELIRNDCLTKTHDPNEPEELKLQYRMEWLDSLGVIPKRRLHLKWHQRSVDTFLGLPFNIASYALLLHMFAQQTNMIPGTLVGDLTNVHIYDNHITYVEEQLGRDPKRYKTPTLKLNKPDSIFDYTFEDFIIEDYKCYSNWKNVPIAV